MTDLQEYSETLAELILHSAYKILENLKKTNNGIVPYGSFGNYKLTIGNINRRLSKKINFETISNLLSDIIYTSFINISYNQSLNLNFGLNIPKCKKLPIQKGIPQYIALNNKENIMEINPVKSKIENNNEKSMVPISQKSPTTFAMENLVSVYNCHAVRAEELRKALERVIACDEIEKYFDFYDSDNDFEDTKNFETQSIHPQISNSIGVKNYQPLELNDMKVSEYDEIEKSLNFDSLESEENSKSYRENVTLVDNSNPEYWQISNLKEKAENNCQPLVNEFKIDEYDEIEKSINFDSFESAENVDFESKIVPNVEEETNELPLLIPILTNLSKNKSENLGSVQEFINKEDTLLRRESIFYIGDSASDHSSIELPRVLFARQPSRNSDSPYFSSRAAEENKFKIDLNDITERCSHCWKGENVTTALSILSLAATLGNFLRLPRMVYFHGGGIFLLIYILLTLVFGIPLTFLEIGLGQFSQHGAVKLWRAVNLFRGVGYAKALLSFVLAVSYSTEIASALALMAYSLNGPLPFAECDVLPTASENGSNMAPIPDSHDRREQCLLETVLASVMEQPMWFGIHFAFLLVIWVAVLICVMKRSVTYRKCMYFIFPGFFALIAALLVQNSSTSSAQTAINKLFVFKWTALGDIQVWYFAMVQMFFSLQIGFGNISTCSGRIYPKTNAFWTAICLVVSNLAMGVASVVLVYLWIGSLNSSTLSFPVPEAFVLSLIYQVSTSTSVIWACLAYILVFLAGLSSLIAFIYTVLVAAAVETKRRWRWRHLNGVICLTACLLGALCIIPGKFSMAHVIEHYMVSHGVIALTILELVGFAVIYGCSNLYNDFEFVIGSKLSSVWRSLWLVTPCVLIVVEICGFCLLPWNREYGHFKDADWQIYLGWALYGTVWVVFLLCAIYQVCIQVDYNVAQKFVSSLKPSRNWGPVDPIYRHCWVQWRNRYQATGARDFTLKRRGTRDYTHHARTSTPAKIDCSTDSLQWPISRH